MAHADPNLKFWFPSMKPSEIVEAFANWGYSISPEQVARPTSEFVMGVYTACLEQVTGINLDALQDAVDQSLANTENSVRGLPWCISSVSLPCSRVSRNYTRRLSLRISCSIICTLFLLFKVLR